MHRFTRREFLGLSVATAAALAACQPTQPPPGEQAAVYLPRLCHKWRRTACSTPS